MDAKKVEGNDKMKGVIFWLVIWVVFGGVLLLEISQYVESRFIASCLLFSFLLIFVIVPACIINKSISKYYR